MRKFADMHIHLSGADFVNIEQLFDTMAECGVTHTAIQALGYRSVSQDLVALYWKQAKTRLNIAAFGSMHLTDMYHDVPFEVMLEHQLKMGFDGLKLIDMCPDVRIATGLGADNARYDRMFSMCEERGTPIVMHAADPSSCWEKPNGTYSHERFMTKSAHFGEVYRMLAKHPKLNICFAHFFFMSDNYDEAVRVMETYPNVYFDLTPGSSMYVDFSHDIEKWHDFFVKYSTRIMFGTDSGPRKNFNRELNSLVYTALTHDSTEFDLPCYRCDTVRGLYLEGEPLDNILYNNYERFLHKSAPSAPFDKAVFINACERVMYDLERCDHSFYRSFFDEIPIMKDDPDEMIAYNFCKEAIKRVDQ